MIYRFIESKKVLTFAVNDIITTFYKSISIVRTHTIRKTVSAT